MIVNGIHESYENPPNVPMITGSISKPPPRESLSEIIAGAATAIVKAINPAPVTTLPTDSTSESRPTNLSPGRCVDVRMKNFQQLRYLQQLYNDSILTEAEYQQQKASIMQALRAL